MNKYLIDLIIKDWKSKGWSVANEYEAYHPKTTTKVLMYHQDMYSKAYVYLFLNTLTFGVTAHYDSVGEVHHAEFDNYEDCMDCILKMKGDEQ